MIFLYIYIGTVIVSILSYALCAAYCGSYCKRHGVEVVRNQSVSEHILAFVKIITISIIPVVNLALIYVCIFKTDMIAEKAMDAIIKDNEEYEKNRDNQSY